MEDAKTMLDTLSQAKFPNSKIGAALGVSGMYVGMLRSGQRQASEKLLDSIKTLYGAYKKEQDDKERQEREAVVQAEQKQETQDIILKRSRKKRAIKPAHEQKAPPMVVEEVVQAVPTITEVRQSDNRSMLETMKGNHKVSTAPMITHTLPTCPTCHKERILIHILVDGRDVHLCKTCLIRDTSSGLLLQDSVYSDVFMSVT
jgi:hypothetical protein